MRRARPSLHAALLVIAAGLAAPRAHADEAAALDTNAVEALHEEAPSLVPVFLEAERIAPNDPLRSIALYADIARQTTAFSEAQRRACLLALEASTRDHALRLCEAATERERTPANLVALALVNATWGDGRALDSTRARELMAEALADPDADAMTEGSACRVEAALDLAAGEACARRLPDGEIAARTTAFRGVLLAAMKAQQTALATRVAQDLTAFAPDDEFGWAQLATLAANRSDVPTLRKAAAQLRRLEKRGPYAPYFESIAFEIEGNGSAAARTLAEAERAGLSPSELVRTRARRAARERTVRLAEGPKWALATAVGGWLLLVASALTLGRRWSERLQAELAGGAPLPREADLSAGKERTRLGYGLALRGFAVLASEHWWSSVWWVATIFLWQPWRAEPGAMLEIGDRLIPFSILIGVAIGTLWRFVRAPKLPDPGLRLPLADHPVLAEILGEVAEAASTPRIDEVYLTRAHELRVVSRGTLLQNLRGTGRPCLVVGAALLQAIDIQAFRALLAQAQQHIAQDEIPGGTFALAVRARYRALRRKRLAQSTWNPSRIAQEWADATFHRLSETAVRFQELRGDRLAAAAYGYDALARGLEATLSPPEPTKREGSPARVVEDPYREEPTDLARPPSEIADRLARVERVARLEGSEDFEEDTKQMAWKLLSKRRELKERLEAHFAKQ